MRQKYVIREDAKGEVVAGPFDRLKEAIAAKEERGKEMAIWFVFEPGPGGHAKEIQADNPVEAVALFSGIPIERLETKVGFATVTRWVLTRDQELIKGWFSVRERW